MSAGLTHFLPLLTIPWRLWVAGLVPPLVLGFPLLLAGWALWRLRGAPSAGGLGRAYLLAHCAVTMQLTPARGERLLASACFITMYEWVHGYLVLQTLIGWRNVPMAIGIGGVLLATWLAYRFGAAAVKERLLAWDTVATLERYTPAQRRAWGLLGHACFWGAFTFIFVAAILRGYFL